MSEETNPVLGVNSESDGIDKVVEALNSGLMSDLFEPEKKEVTTNDDAGESEQGQSEEVVVEHTEPDTGESTGTEEGQPDDKDAGTKVEETPDTYEVDGVEYTLDDLKSGNLRQADYTKKTQEHADNVKQFTEQSDAAKVRLGDMLGTAESLAYADALPFQNLDWDALKADDPEEYQDKRAAFSEIQDRYQKVKAIQADMAKDAAEKQEGQLKVLMQEQGVLLKQAIPAFADKEAGPKLRAELTEYGKSIGYTEQQLGSVIMHTDLVVLQKAMLFDRMQTKKSNVLDKKVPKDLQKVMRRGSPANIEAEAQSKAEDSFQTALSSHNSDKIIDALFNKME